MPWEMTDEEWNEVVAKMPKGWFVAPTKLNDEQLAAEIKAMEEVTRQGYPGLTEECVKAHTIKWLAFTMVEEARWNRNKDSKQVLAGIVERLSPPRPPFTRRV